MRLTTKNDFDAVYQIYMDESVNPYMHYEVMDKEAFKPVFAEIMAGDYSWVCEQGGAVIGMCSAIIGTGRVSHVAKLSSLGMSPTHQGKGLGKKFVTSIISALKNTNITRIELAVETDNPGAIKFYEAIGFQSEGRLRNYIKRKNSEEYVDDFLMSQIF